MGNNLSLIQTYRKDVKYPPNIGYSLRSGQPKSILVHTTNGRKNSSFENEALFLRDNAIAKDAQGKYYLYDPDKAVSANFLLGKQGQIAEIVSPQYAAWHSGKCFNSLFENPTSIGIEIHYTPGEGAWTPEMWAALTALVRSLMLQYDILETNIDMHRIQAKPRGRKIDPSGITDAEFYAWRAALTQPTPERIIGTYTKNTTLTGSAPPIDPAWAVDFIFRKTKPVYPRVSTEGGDADNVTSIVNLYTQTASSVGLDWWLVLCQMCHETGKLSSWWCSPPRRNPAGIGVTGAKSDVQPRAGAWEYHEKDRIWKAGYRFLSWENAVQAHVAHLLCYVYTDAEMSPEQLLFSYKSPRRDFIPIAYRGAAKQISGLTQRWAWSKVLPPEGERYHNRIIALANSL